MQIIGSGENTIAIMRASNGAVLIKVGEETIVLSVKDARFLAAEINRILRQPLPKQET